jgi:ParB/RepB/Spo0J family partition protein
MAATMSAMKQQAETISVTHTCGHVIDAPACYMQPHRIKHEERRPCQACRDTPRGAAALANWELGLPALDETRGTPRQRLYAEELRHRFGWELAGEEIQGRTDCIWWIAEYAGRAREEDASASARPAGEVVAEQPANLTAEQKAHEVAEFERIFGDGPRKPQPPSGGGGAPRACESCGVVEEGGNPLELFIGRLLCYDCMPQDAPACEHCGAWPCLADDEGAKEETMASQKAPDAAALAQYRAIKAKHPDVLLLQQSGDHYHAYEGDAARIGAALDLRPDEGGILAIAAHAVEGSVARLIARGLRVALAGPADAPNASDIPRQRVPLAATIDLNPRTVPCPTCGAREGSPCKRPSGHVIPLGEVHAARREAVRIANLPPEEKAAREAHIRSILDEDAAPSHAPLPAPPPAGTPWRLLPVGQIRPSPDNPRRQFDPPALKELAASIKEHGLLEPLVVRPAGHDFEIIAGERRFRAATAAGLDNVPVIIRQANDREALEVMLVENLQRQDLNPIEEAGAYARLSEMGLTQEQIAAKVGRSRPAVANAMRLLKLPEEAKAMVADGRISAAHGAALLHWAAPGKEKQCLEYAQGAAKGYYGSKELEKQAQYDAQREKREAERKAERAAAAEAGAKGGAVVETWQEYHARQARGQQAAREARQPRVAELAEALREAREERPILEDRRAMALLAHRFMSHRLGIVQHVLSQAGYEELLERLDWENHTFRERWEALAELDAETLLTLAFRVEMANDLAGFAEWGQEKRAVDWYLGIAEEEPVEDLGGEEDEPADEVAE